MNKKRIVYFILLKYIFFFIFLIYIKHHYEIYTNHVIDIIIYFIMFMLPIILFMMLIFTLPLNYIFKMKNNFLFIISILLLLFFEYIMYNIMSATSNYFLGVYNGIFSLILGVLYFGLVSKYLKKKSPTHTKNLKQEL